MSQLAVLFLVLTVFVDTLGQLLLKAAAYKSAHLNGVKHWKHMLSKPWIWVGLACYIFEFVLWLAFLSLVELSEGVMLGSINTVVIMIVGRIWFKEKMTPWRVSGILMITLGVAIVGMNS